jgi:hypothetical protein
MEVLPEVVGEEMQDTAPPDRIQQHRVDLVIVLDDFQWCNAASLALFRHLSRDLNDVGALVTAA